MKINEAQLRNIVRQLMAEAYDQSLLLKVNDVAQYVIDRMDDWVPYADDFEYADPEMDPTNPVVRQGMMKNFLLRRRTLSDLGVTSSWVNKNFDLISKKVDQRLDFSLIDDDYYEY